MLIILWTLRKKMNEHQCAFRLILWTLIINPNTLWSIQRIIKVVPKLKIILVWTCHNITVKISDLTILNWILFLNWRLFRNTLVPKLDVDLGTQSLSCVCLFEGVLYHPKTETEFSPSLSPLAYSLNFWTLMISLLLALLQCFHCLLV